MSTIATPLAVIDEGGLAPNTGLLPRRLLTACPGRK